MSKTQKATLEYLFYSCPSKNTTAGLSYTLLLRAFFRSCKYILCCLALTDTFFTTGQLVGPPMCCHPGPLTALHMSSSQNDIFYTGGYDTTIRFYFDYSFNLTGIFKYFFNCLVK